MHSGTHLSLPEVSVTMEAHEADKAARRDATFCLETSRVFCFHFNEAYNRCKLKSRVVLPLNLEVQETSLQTNLLQL